MLNVLKNPASYLASGYFRQHCVNPSGIASTLSTYIDNSIFIGLYFAALKTFTLFSKEQAICCEKLYDLMVNKEQIIWLINSGCIPIFIDILYPLEFIVFSELSKSAEQQLGDTVKLLLTKIKTHALTAISGIVPNTEAPMVNTHSELVVFEDNCKVYFYNEYGHYWKERGRGNLKLIWNMMTQILRLELIDKDYNNLRLSQTFHSKHWLDFDMQLHRSKLPEDDTFKSFIEWHNTDYSWDEPLTAAFRCYLDDDFSCRKFLQIILSLYYAQGLPPWCLDFHNNLNPFW